MNFIREVLFHLSFRVRAARIRNINTSIRRYFFRDTIGISKAKDNNRNLRPKRRLVAKEKSLGFYRIL